MSKNTEESVEDILTGIIHLLKYKNSKYGDAAIKPEHFFYKGTSQDSILIRLDDKMSRIKNNKDAPRVNDVSDLIGYCTLLLVSMGVTSEDIKKFED